MWTATLVDSLQGDPWTYRFILSDGTHKAETSLRGNNLSNADLEQFCRSEAARLDAAVAPQKVTYRLGDQIDLAPPVAVQPAPTDTARVQFLSDWNSLQALNRAVAAGFVQANDQRIAPLQSNISKNWLDSYVGLV